MHMVAIERTPRCMQKFTIADRIKNVSRSFFLINYAILSKKNQAILSKSITNEYSRESEKSDFFIQTFSI